MTSATSPTLVAPPLARDRPRVTCVMIFLDAATFIEESIRSVVAQTCADWELLLVDDGSTDESSAIARRWARADGRIRYLEHDGHANLGMSASRNLGVAEARGELVAFLDSDDVWMPSALAHRLRVLEAHPTADAVVGGTWRWYSWSGDPTAFHLDHRMALPPAAPLLQVLDPGESFVAVYGTPDVWYVPATCSIVVRREALRAVGGLSDDFTGMYEDQVLYTKVLLGLRVVFDARALSLYRQHDASACATAMRSGAWHPVAASASRDRFVAWLADYVPADRRHDAVGDVIARIVDASRSAVADVPGGGDQSPTAAPDGDLGTPPPGALAARARHVAGALRRSVQYRFGRRRDIAWLLDRWAREHASGWPPSSTTVIDIPLRHRLRPERCLDAIRERRRAGATLVAIVPARRARPTRWRVPSPTAASLERAARRAFPDATITVEPLGNDRVRAALAAGVHVSEVAPVELDRHDGESPMVWALAVDTALRVRR